AGKVASARTPPTPEAGRRPGLETSCNEQVSGKNERGTYRQIRQKSRRRFGRRETRCSAPLAVPHRADRQQQQAEAEEAAEQRYAADGLQHAVVGGPKADPVAARSLAGRTDGDY